MSVGMILHFKLSFSSKYFTHNFKEMSNQREGC
jgi:hypothetical protein